MFEVFKRFGLRRTLSMFDGGTHPVNGVRYGVLQSFCGINESPELPDWFKSPQDDNSSSHDSKDDFVLPKLINWVSNQKVDDRNINIKCVSIETIDNDVNKISRILKSRFWSPDTVIQALDGCNVNVSKDLVHKLLKRFSNDWVSVFGFFKWVHMQTGCSHSADTYDLMVDILGKSKQFDPMWELVEKMVNFGGLISLGTMTKIMRRLAGAGRWKDAIETFRGIERFGVRKDSSAMNLLLDALCKERSVEHAQAAFLEFKNEIPPDSHTFNVLIHGWCRARQMDKAWWTMEEMERYGFQPCVVSYTSLIEAYCWEKDFRKVYAILDEMQAKGCSPNVVTYTIVMHSHGKAKETREAVETYERMKRNGCVPDTSFYNSLIYILSKAGRFQDAHDVYEEISKSGNTPNVTTYNTMISAACEHSQEEMALKLLQGMEKNLCKPDLKTYAPLLKMCCRKKWMKVLFYLLNDMFKKDVSIEFGTYTLLVRGLCQSGKLEHACSFFEEMVFKGLVPMDCTYSMLVEELGRKNMEKAKERIQHLMAQAKSMERAERSCRTYSEGID
ncbi:pentatricopeptide repeat-containing protein At3g22670, mitochondrial-like isoform X1 [Telopea speciosissima]|uniref:pentatricopeptide repeat-containing protein At3g22670, mitochondrial-like isoform X1 n=1 Tax=Telopea speciosissima TaxID=54955 RepID=UPI001CC3A1A2|nr:pentatricopeptide repeat-containing protein At3g22670, mitochondrial-like isoform X1 [Telopea speciosissima]